MGIKVTTKEGYIIEGDNANEVVLTARRLSDKRSGVIIEGKEEEKIKRSRRAFTRSKWTDNEESLLRELMQAGHERSVITKDKVLRMRHTRKAISQRMQLRKKDYENQGLRNQ